MAKQAGPLSRFLKPAIFFVGVVFSFVCCSLGGYLASQRNPYHNSGRFHAFLNPETLYYPTAGQVCALARERLAPDKIAVIVGGSSRLHGTGQTASQVWTLKLQKLLGARFEVLNFGFRSASPWEIGATVAEVLSQEHRRFILITDCGPAWIDPRPDGHSFKYFFWGAYYKGLLRDDPKREELIRQMEKWDHSQRANADVRHRAWLDSLFYFDDLWNTCAYSWFSTVWTPATRHSVSRPRWKYDDPERGAPRLENRYPAASQNEVLASIRNMIAGVCTKQADGVWIENPHSDKWALFEQSARFCYPEVLHQQTLFIVSYHSPWYTKRLSVDERGCLTKAGQISVSKLESCGYRALEIGQGYTAADYADYQHLSESGGSKMSQAVAYKVRTMASRLGFIKEDP